MNRLLLIRHGPTAATEASAFPEDEDLVEGLESRFLAVRSQLPQAGVTLSSAAKRALATAGALGLRPEVDQALDECDFGSWRGRTFSQIHQTEPEALSVWLRDPDAAPHGGESLVTLAARVRRFLQRATELDGITIAITHGGVIKVAIASVLEAPLSSVWRIEVAPLSITEIERFDEGWTLRRVRWTAPTDEHA